MVRRMKLSDVENISHANYKVDISWNQLEFMLKEYMKNYNLNLEPDFQRSHVWSTEQQRMYVEWVLRGGMSGKTLYFNCPNWRINPQGRMVLVDGLQRLTAVRLFMSNKLPIFGGKFLCDFDGNPDMIVASFEFKINDLETRREVLKWYLDLNEGGTPHSVMELQMVRTMYDATIVEDE